MAVIDPDEYVAGIDADLDRRHIEELTRERDLLLKEIAALSKRVYELESQSSKPALVCNWCEKVFRSSIERDTHEEFCGINRKW